ncbi:phage major capsid protein, P2 family [Variovorax sp. YR752]|uniref:phage major capsid protein, P2 family n=1 Tax=Variovorax sp. YR752 TaxID=1884383 RepID=UPI000BCC7034|nr:phage major capsid protein, P2 family [Variovorax sp. YR752]SOD25287.1 phage major capsid protein, P2 family [Variovorax sp. YR752]SOD27676.1 phage major capsid protein, P2 family [Variovorax sp. YR752]
MRNDTRLVYNQLIERLGEINNVPSAREQFAVEPTVQQTLETKIQESSEFLGLINIIGVDELKGEKLGLGVSGPIASRTNTDQADRQPRSVETLDATGYECKHTDYDTYIKYGTLDAWAKFPDFQTKVRDVIVKRQALDRIMIGFNGTSAAANTNLAANPLLQDVNIGWLQHIRTDAPTRVMDDGADNQIQVGAGGDYKNLDALVYDAYQTLLDPWYRNDGGLVAIVGRNLMHDKLFPLVSNPDAPTEILAADIVRSQARLGGLPGLTLPHFPDNTVLVTRLDNLSIYWQRSARRRNLVDNPKRSRIENYESSNDAFVVEDYGLACLIENIDVLG